MTPPRVNTAIAWLAATRAFYFRLLITFRVSVFTRSATHRFLRFCRSLIYRRWLPHHRRTLWPNQVQIYHWFLGEYRTPPILHLVHKDFHFRFQWPEEGKAVHLLNAILLYGVCRHLSPTIHFIHLLAPFLGACTYSLPVDFSACAKSFPDFSTALAAWNRRWQNQLHVCRCKYGYTFSCIPACRAHCDILVFLTLRTS